MHGDHRRFRPSIHAGIIVLGVLLLTPSLWSGFWLDDFFYIAACEGETLVSRAETPSEAGAPVDRRRDPSWKQLPFFVGDERVTAGLAEQGHYPWWIHDSLLIAVFRPLAMLLIRIDHALFGHGAVGYHLHSLVWWLATLLAWGFVLRRVLPGAVGLLALLLFAIDDVHVLPVAWIANRNALVALAPVLLALWAHIRWREDGWRPGRWLAAAGMAVGLLGSEIALSAIAYLVAYELCGAPVKGARARCAGLAPVFALGIVYIVVYRLAGCGTAGCGLYVHPLHDPVRFLIRAVTNIPTLLTSGIAGISADFWFVVPASRPILVAAGYAALGGLLVLLRGVWSDLDAGHRRAVRWLLCGSGLAMLPTVGTFPSDRMVFIPGMGLAAALATVLLHAWRSWRGRHARRLGRAGRAGRNERRVRRRWWLWVAGGWLALVHLALAPFFSIYIQRVIHQQTVWSREIACSQVVHDARDKQTVLIYCPDYLVALYLPMLIDFLEIPAPASWRTLSLAPYAHTLRRPAPRILELEVAAGGVMLRSVFEELYRDRQHQLRPGDGLDRGLFRAEILAGTDDGPSRVAFHFDRDLDDPSLEFLVWQGGELRPAVLPAVGDTVSYTWSVGPGGF